MPDEPNPYQSPPGGAETTPVKSNSNGPHWPQRLNVCILLFASFALLLPAFQLRRTTGGGELYADAIQALIPMIPFAVLIPALGISSIRYRRSSLLAKRFAGLLLVLYTGFMFWAWYEWTFPY